MQLEEKQVGAICHGAAISFLPLFWLYFNERIYEYRDKVKWCCTLQFVVSYQWEKYRNLARSPQSFFEIVADFKEKCRLQTSILMEKCLKGLWFVGKSGAIHLKKCKVHSRQLNSGKISNIVTKPISLENKRLTLTALFLWEAGWICYCNI